MSVIYLTIETCLIYLGELISLLGNIDIAEGVSLLEFVYGFLILTIVVTALISVVKVGSMGIGHRVSDFIKRSAPVARDHSAARKRK